MTNRMAQMTDIKKITISECEMPSPKKDELLVEIGYVGICGSDMHFFTHGRIGKKVIDRPFILGHEFTGTVKSIGEGVTEFKVGDRVVMEPGIPCGICGFCREGRYNLCPNVEFMASPPRDGALRKYITFPAHMSFKLPNEISNLTGAMIEPLAVGMHAASRGEVALGKTVCILGSGPIGIMTILACKAMSATQIFVTDLFDKRLKNASRLGADVVINSKDTDAEKAILEATNGEGVDIVFETAGNPITMAQSPKLVRRGGVIVVVGNITEDVSFEFLSITNREVDIRPVFRYRNIFPVAIEAIASGKIDLSAIDPTIFDFEDTEHAFLHTLENAQDIIKSVIKVAD